MEDVDLKLIKKYNVQGPRYTSYPTAVQFKESDEKDLASLVDHLRDHNLEKRRVSLYVHIPFCFSLCWYCGCTKVITKDQESGDRYLDYLEKEMDLVSGLLHPNSEVIQIHFGGGTPTFLSPKQLRRLGNIIDERFNIIEETEYGVEIDPRRCTREHISALRQIGCNRASLGIQDTNQEVQEAIHRVQPFGQTKDVLRWLREEGIDSINFDLIYGLPKQTLNTFRKTMDDVMQLRPDRLAVYSYAHIPQIMPAQKLLNAQEMPSTDEKLAMLQLSITHLTENGYRFIGMDHFSAEDEELSKAMDEDTLHRNFQGYSTHSGADLYAFGMSGISNVGGVYWQNDKEIESYYRSLDENRFPIIKKLSLNRDDMIRKDAIMKIMCRSRLSYHEMEELWNIRFTDYFAESLEKLRPLEEDGLVEIQKRNIIITKTGRLFLRNIAMCFDAYLQDREVSQSFSKTI
ncbi:MAG: oxygen-independent coproporphyrinogen III oxidase [Bacteroidetes bacterium]|jgi:oxygen-independent coproporphyrinogen-3 oxidase|nr:oxygen-independent coproporphyrinogen III oxidase [Bacteroidota bacterium]